MNRLQRWALGQPIKFFKEHHTVYEEFKPHNRPTLSGPTWFICDDALIRLNGLIKITTHTFPHDPDTIRCILYDSTRNSFAIIHTNDDYRIHTQHYDNEISETEIKRLANFLDVGFNSYNCHPADHDERHMVPDFLLKKAWGTTDFYPLTFREVIDRHIALSNDEDALPLPSSR